jgi:hypothetical protein
MNNISEKSRVAYKAYKDWPWTEGGKVRVGGGRKEETGLNGCSEGDGSTQGKLERTSGGTESWAGWALSLSLHRSRRGSFFFFFFYCF